MHPIAVLAVVALVAAAGLAGYAVGAVTGRASTITPSAPTSTHVITSTSHSSSNSTFSTNSTFANATEILPEGATFQVQSSHDCLAGHLALPFNVTDPAGASLSGRINADQPGVSIYLSTALAARTTFQGHPADYLFVSGLNNSTGFAVGFLQGSYVLWIEGADIGCGTGVVTPLEQLITVTVTQEVTITPGLPFIDVGPGQT
jgi:hypothetical protein